MNISRTAALRDYVQEVIELGPRRTWFRARWELEQRLLPARTPSRVAGASAGRTNAPAGWVQRLPFADPFAVARVMRDVADPRELLRLQDAAREALAGRIRCFGSWKGEFGNPIDWSRNPITGLSWDSRTATARSQVNGDIKLTWEIARFPQAYTIARAAAFYPEHASTFAFGLVAQMKSFVRSNPCGQGVHWTSGQETAIRLLAWVFALDVFLSRSSLAEEATLLVEDALAVGAAHIECNLDYARYGVDNNHLLAEALALYGVGSVLATRAPEAAQWRDKGRRILDEQASRQFRSDGGYFMNAHNYHRAALQYLLWACAFARVAGDRPADSWLSALGRSVDFLAAHQNPEDGRLPNYGANDGSMPSLLSTCAFSDFRPTLQTASVAARGERLYSPGPWDESVAWFLGVTALDAPLRQVSRTSVSLKESGYHVLRGRGSDSFCAFRCGTLRERYSQIDMLHLDVWWRGLNVLVDPGSYQYSAAPQWHEHFMRTASHNTVEVDGHDQMQHHRQFKVVYWTKARLLAFADHGAWATCEGEHYGYRRHGGRCVHRRSILFVKDDLWIVVDRVEGVGDHSARLHWLAADFKHTYEPGRGELQLATPEGSFAIQVLDERALPVTGDVVRGSEEPPRGWLSRYYAERVAVPSLAVVTRGPVPLVFVSVLSGGSAVAGITDGMWHVRHPSAEVAFKLVDGRFVDVIVRETR